MEEIDKTLIQLEESKRLQQELTTQNEDLRRIKQEIAVKLTVGSLIVGFSVAIKICSFIRREPHHATYYSGGPLGGPLGGTLLMLPVQLQRQVTDWPGF